ncbi:MAG: outer membrane beta-barrel protein [Nitrospirota bacterium]
MILLWACRYAGLRQPFGFALVAVLGWGALQPAFIQAETRIIPAVYAGGRYDSNIFMTLKSSLPPGTQFNDYVATVGGGAQLLDRSRDVDASLYAGVDVNEYAINKGYSYYTARLDGYAILDGWVERFARGARLRVDERFQYTPESPGFMTGVQGASSADPFQRGLGTSRANTYSNVTSVDGSYPLLRELVLQGGYSYGLYKTAGRLVNVGPSVSFFNTTINSWSLGPGYKLTQQDSISLLFSQRLIIQEQSTGGAPIYTNAQSLMANYERVMPTWKIGFGAGPTLIDPVNRAYTVGYFRFSTNPDQSTTVVLDLSRLATPSFFLVAGALMSNVGRAEITHRLSDRLTLAGSVGYAYNQLITTGSTATFKTLSANTGLTYMLTRTMSAEFFYRYTDFVNDSPAINYEVSRNQVGFALTARWE